MGLHRPLAEEERRGDFTIRAPFRNEGRDAALGRRQALAACAPADPAELGTRLRGPASSAERLERFERRLDCLAGRTLLATATPDDAERQQRPSTAERIADRLVFGDRLSEQRQGRLDVAAGGGDEPPAASRLGHYPVAAEPRRIGLPDL